MLVFIAGILVILWLIGLVAHIAGGLIHIVLVLAVIVLVYHFLVNRRSV